jgi:hypothetical protein
VRRVVSLRQAAAAPVRRFARLDYGRRLRAWQAAARKFGEKEQGTVVPLRTFDPHCLGQA